MIPKELDRKIYDAMHNAFKEGCAYPKLDWHDSASCDIAVWVAPDWTKPEVDADWVDALPEDEFQKLCQLVRLRRDDAARSASLCVQLSEEEKTLALRHRASAAMALNQRTGCGLLTAKHAVDRWREAREAEGQNDE